MEELIQLLSENTDKRVSVVGTTCIGKSTLVSQIPGALDLDEIFFPLLTAEEKARVSQAVWDETVGEVVGQLIRERVHTEIGKPLFGTEIVDADLLIYLQIDYDILRERCKKRKVPFQSALDMDRVIRKEVADSMIPTRVINL
jgi:shikimate kinase